MFKLLLEIPIFTSTSPHLRELRNSGLSLGIRDKVIKCKKIVTPYPDEFELEPSQTGTDSYSWVWRERSWFGGAFWLVLGSALITCAIILCIMDYATYSTVWRSPVVWPWVTAIGLLTLSPAIVAIGVTRVAMLDGYENRLRMSLHWYGLILEQKDYRGGEFEWQSVEMLLNVRRGESIACFGVCLVTADQSMLICRYLQAEKNSRYSRNLAEKCGLETIVSNVTIITPGAASPFD